VGWPQVAQGTCLGLSEAPHSPQKATLGGFQWPQAEEPGVISGMSAGRCICDLRIGKAKAFKRPPPFSYDYRVSLIHFICPHVGIEQTPGQAHSS
jgi:hypothetical protein